MNPPPLLVLIVDDNPTVAATLRAILRRLGKGLVYESVWVATGAAALAELEKQQFQVVLLDYKLPDQDGLSVLRAIKARPASSRTPVIMLTGGGSEQVAVDAMKLGARDYILKARLNTAVLRRSLDAALEHQRLAEELARSTEELRRKNAQMEADLALARGVQQALLPQNYPVFPAGTPAGRSTLQFCHRWIPSEKVAGDFFDVFPLTENTAGVFLCDVMGHGVRAALVTALVRGLLREQKHHADRPGVFLGAINRSLQALLGRTGDLLFVTATYLVVEAVTGKVSLASAGHPAPFHLRRRDGTVAPLAGPDGPGSALGLLPDSLYDVVEATLAPGDAVLLFTDGIFEATDAAGGEFGRDRLRDAVAARLALPTPLLIDAVLAEIRAFQANGENGFEDDVCLVAMDRAES